MTEYVECSAKNELEQEMIIQGSFAWIYDFRDQFIGDFKINFCPICGKDINIH
jgi:hypothetical protein